MPPNLNIYCLTRRRDAETVNIFLDRYVDRPHSEDREGVALMVRKLDAPSDSDGVQDYEWEHAPTLTHAVQRGLDYPRRSFALYLKPKRPEIAGAVLGFTSDDQLVLGLSVDDESERPENLERAKELLSGLAEEFNGHHGLILVEEPPPHSEDVFQRKADDSHALCLYSCVWRRET